MSYALTTSESAVSPSHLWRLDEASSSTTSADLGSAPLSLTWTGNHQLAISGNAASFDGATYAAHPHVGGGDTSTGDFTVGAWILLPAGNQNSAICCWGGGVILRIGDGNYGTGSKFYAEIASQGGTLDTTPPTITAGVWTHVAVTRSGTTYTLYKNGVSVGVKTIAGTAAFFNDFYVGQKYDGTAFFTGTITTPIYCTAARSAPELLAIFNAGPDVVPLATRQAAFLAYKAGISHHISLITLGPREDGGSQYGTGTSLTLWNFPQLDTDQWADVDVAAGAKYARLTCQHADGVCLWNSASNARNTHNAPTPVDVLALFSTSLAKRGIALDVYLGNQQNDAPGAAIAATQIGEVLSGTYGVVKQLLWDHYSSSVGDGALAFTNVIRAPITLYQPGCLFIDNDGEYSTSRSDILESEQATQAFANDLTTHASEFWDTCWKELTWFWNVAFTPKDWQTLWLSRYFAWANGANYMLNIPPDTTGRIPANLAALAKQAFQQGIEAAASKATSASSCIQSATTVLGSANQTNGPQQLVLGLPTGAVYQSHSTDNTPWVEVDFGATVAVDGVRVFCVGTTGVATSRLRDLTFTVYDASHTLLYTSAVIAPSAPTDTPNNLFLDCPFPAGMRGRYVRVQRNAAGTVATWTTNTGTDSVATLQLTAMHVVSSGSLVAGDLPVKQSVSLSQAANAASVAMAETVVSPDASTFNAEWTNSAAGDVHVNFRYRLTAGGQLYDGAAVIITAGTVTPVNKPVSLPKGIYSIVPLMTRTDGLTAGTVTAAGFFTAQ